MSFDIATKLPLDPDDAEFAAIRADLARLFITHEADLALDQPDDEIVQRTNDIAAALMAHGQRALAQGDAEWLDRHRWFSDATERLFRDESAVPLGG